ncbi:MAG: hypothetical protein HY074_08555, partial [Deltaproteobacteria bacterium]|nr:hypothetical protein [Deltaproteobacteria bacterium]
MKTLALQLCLFSVLASAMTGPAHAWDGHGLLTRRALLGFQKQNPQLWQKLQTTLAVTPLESLLTRAFGESCGYGVAKDAVFEGYGKFYEVLYTEKVNYRYELGWDKGYSRQVNEPFPADATKNSQALGRVVTVESIFATYADEPDWGADDDVAQL